jgi:molybdenum cofactor guanylyltransferase
VLVGGQSSRMGRDKALLPTGSRFLVQQIADAVGAVAGSVALVGSPDTYRNRFALDCLDDMRPGYGPLSGIHAAVSSGRGDYNLIVACDMPAVPQGLFAALFAVAEKHQARCVVTIDSARNVHPLCAVYHHDALYAVERALDNSQLRLMDLLRDLDAIRFETSLNVQNCNTPAEWAAFEQA